MYENPLFFGYFEPEGQHPPMSKICLVCHPSQNDLPPSTPTSYIFLMNILLLLNPKITVWVWIIIVWVRIILVVIISIIFYLPLLTYWWTIGLFTYILKIILHKLVSILQLKLNFLFNNKCHKHGLIIFFHELKFGKEFNINGGWDFIVFF